MLRLAVLSETLAGSDRIAAAVGSFAGRGYVPGPVGNNKAKNSTTAAMLSLDWMEFGRARGCTMLWTEDW